MLDVHTLHMWSKHEDAKDRRPAQAECTLHGRGALTVRKVRRKRKEEKEKKQSNVEQEIR